MGCLLCNSEYFREPIFKIQDRLNLTEKIFDVYQCKSCFSLFIYPLPSEQEIERLYPRDYSFKKIPDEKGIKGIIKNFEWGVFYKRIYLRNYRLICKVLQRTKFKMLDVGCGSGLRLKIFRDLGCDVEGNDISVSCVEYIKKTLKIPVYKGKVEDLNLNSSYDVITMFALMEHLTNPGETIIAIKKLLKKGGLLVIQAPIIDSLQYKILRQRVLPITDMPRHIFFPSIKGLKSVMDKSGFELILYEPASLLVSAASFSLGLYRKSVYAISYGKPGFNFAFRRVLGWMLAIFFGIPIGLLEMVTGKGIETIFFFKKAAE